MTSYTYDENDYQLPGRDTKNIFTGAQSQNVIRMESSVGDSS